MIERTGSGKPIARGLGVSFRRWPLLWRRRGVAVVVPMHFRPAFDDDFVAALQAIAAAGLVPARLEDYLG